MMRYEATRERVADEKERPWGMPSFVSIPMEIAADGSLQSTDKEGSVPFKASSKSDLSHWDSFWARHGANGRLFDWCLWLTRRLFSRHHATLLLDYARRDGSSGNPSLRVLEVGCGSAMTSKFIASKDVQVRIVGVDLSVTAIKLASSLNPQLTGIIADASSLPFDKNQFSLTFSSGVIEHFDRQIAQMMQGEQRRVTKPSGTVGLIVPWKYSPYNLLRMLCGKRWPFGDENPFSISELKSFAQRNLLRDVDVRIGYGTTLAAMGRKDSA